MKKLNPVGEIYLTNNKQSFIITEYYNYYNCTIKFEDGTIIKNKQLGSIKSGTIFNPNFKSVYNRGYIGIGNYKPSIKGIKSKNYSTWYDMLKRCYSEKYHQKQISYKDCSVCNEWLNFQNFAKWFDENYIEDFHLDKDILIKGNKIYSPETCCFVPQEINSLFVNRNNFRGILPIGVTKGNKKFNVKCNIENKSIYIGQYFTIEEAFNAYKTIKEKEIKRIVSKWKNKLSDNLFNIIYNYEIEITD